MTITVVNEKDKILDTGGGVLNAIEHFSNEPFIVINPDTIWNLNYLEELETMEKKKIFPVDVLAETNPLKESLKSKAQLHNDNFKTGNMGWFHQRGQSCLKPPEW